YFPLRSGHGEVVGLIGAVLEVTERKQAEQRLLESEERFRALVEASAEVVWTCDEHGATHEASPSWCAFTGQSHEEWLGWGWHEAIHPEDRQRVAAQWHQCLVERRHYVIEYRLRHRDGGYRWTLARATPLLDKAGTLKGWVGMNADITDRKQAEEVVRESETRLRLAVETAELGTYERDLLTNQVSLNAICRQVLGVSAEHLPPDVAYQSVHPLDKERVFAAAARAFDPSRREVCAAEFRILKPDGTLRWVAGRGRVIFDDNVRPAQARKFMGVLNDITNRKLAEEELLRAKDVLSRVNADLELKVEQRTAKLRESIAELEGFSYSLVHDLRAPLRAMQTYATVLEEEAGTHLQPDSSEYLRRIKVAANRMDQLITDSLNYSKVVREELPLGPVNVGRLLRGLVETYPNLQLPGAEVTVEINNLLVLGNEAALTQVFSNLLGNAVKFVAPGVKPRVRVWAQEMQTDEVQSRDTEGRGENVASQPQAVRIWVEDNGIGIPKEGHGKIFGMFQRMHRAEEYPGTGIGLAIVRKSLERMGGQIYLESEPGRGSRFCVELARASERARGGEAGATDESPVHFLDIS
ncbi:MAG TPA: PAS domain S-box protein, partial [Clostridia bacterium]|nr:PAS domain S-box protein [Clostridia bacterium]